MTNTLLRKHEIDCPGTGGGRDRVELAHRLHLELTDDQVAVITFDHPDKSANLFDRQTLDELNVALDAMDSLSVTGVVFRSAKPSIFIAGADLAELEGASDEELERLIRKGQETFQRIADLGAPTVAAIHGACLGGGLEMALACDRRVASDDKATKIGLPETQLGILPAWGGSTRLPRLIGLPGALDQILGGKTSGGSYARKLGLVDRVVPKERLEDAALSEIEKPFPRRSSHFWTNNPASAEIIRLVSRRKLLRKTRGHYPAQEAALDVVARGASGSVAKSLRRERQSVLRLARTPAAKNLMRLFHLQEAAKKPSDRDFRLLATRPSESEGGDSSGARGAPVKRTAVIGAGVMGAGIAQWFASRGWPVILQDIDRERVAAGMKSVRKLFDEAVRKHILTKREARRRLDGISPTAEKAPLRHCDLVVEAAVEDLSVKKKIFADLSERTSPDTVLATNTSALPIASLGDAPGVTHPERIVGLHFFNPVSRMKLVEVVVTDRTSPETLDRALAFVRGIGKLPVVVKDSPGFLVNRILMPYLIEAGRMVDAGYSPQEIDEAMLDFGMPMGPLRLLDEVGLDVAGHVAATMREAFGDRFELPSVLNRLVREERFGRKSGGGFYDYEDGKPVSKGETPAESGMMSRDEITERLVSLMVDEARRCLDEGVAASADDVDLAMVMGTGFAPFRGGPLAHAEAEKRH